MECDGSDKHGITIPAMVTIICSKKIYHMFGRIVTNLEIDSYN